MEMMVVITYCKQEKSLIFLPLFRLELVPFISCPQNFPIVYNMTITRENVTTVPVTKGTRDRLRALKGYGDCYEHVIVRVLENYEANNGGVKK